MWEGRLIDETRLKPVIDTCWSGWVMRTLEETIILFCFCLFEMFPNKVTLPNYHLHNLLLIMTCYRFIFYPLVNGYLFPWTASSVKAGTRSVVLFWTQWISKHPLRIRLPLESHSLESECKPSARCSTEKIQKPGFHHPSQSNSLHPRGKWVQPVSLGFW